MELILFCFEHRGKRLEIYREIFSVRQHSVELLKNMLLKHVKFYE